jgi:hypothetical protein
MILIDALEHAGHGVRDIVEARAAQTLLSYCPRQQRME